MIIEYLKGPTRGMIEHIVDQLEENGVPIYITESGKYLSNNDLNSLFRFRQSGASNNDLRELSALDPSLAEQLQTGSNIIEEEKILLKEQEQKNQGKYVEINTGSNVQPTEMNMLDMFLKTAKKEDISKNINVSLRVPSWQFYDLISSAVDVTEEEFLDKVMKSLDTEDIFAAIRKELSQYYNFKDKEDALAEDSLPKTISKSELPELPEPPEPRLYRGDGSPIYSQKYPAKTKDKGELKKKK